MKVNIFFLTIIIKRRKITPEEVQQKVKVDKIYEENRRKVENYIRYY